VYPYKATHFENRKSILHYITFMVLHKYSHHNIVIGLPNLFQNTGNPDRFSSAKKQYDCSLQYFHNHVHHKAVAIEKE